MASIGYSRGNTSYGFEEFMKELKLSVSIKPLFFVPLLSDPNLQKNEEAQCGPLWISFIADSCMQ